MKSLVKWGAFLGIIIAVLQVAFAEFMPKFQEWQEKYPPEPEEEETEETATAQPVTAETLFQPQIESEVKHG